MRYELAIYQGSEKHWLYLIDRRQEPPLFQPAASFESRDAAEFIRELCGPLPDSDLSTALSMIHSLRKVAYESVVSSD